MFIDVYIYVYRCLYICLWKLINPLVAYKNGREGRLLAPFHVLIELFIERMSGQSSDITQYDELHTGPCYGHVHASNVTQEANLSLVIAAHQGDENDVTLLPLKAIHGVDTDE